MSSSLIRMFRQHFATGANSRKARRLGGDLSGRFETGHIWRGGVRVLSPDVPRAGELVLAHYSSDELQRASSLFDPNQISYVDSFAHAGHVSDAPPVVGVESELVLMGRSNCGKSTLLNAVLGREMAKVSQRPGHTRTANRFRVADLFTLIDLPGYGFAEATREMRKLWGEMEQAFFERRESVSLFLLLVDARRGITDLDQERIERLETHARPYQLILTKADKLTPAELRRCVEKTEEKVRDKSKRFSAPTVVATSSLVNNYGIDVLRAVLLETAGKSARFRTPASLALDNSIIGLPEDELHTKVSQPKGGTMTKEELIARHVDGLAFQERQRAQREQEEEEEQANKQQRQE
jgi:GTP-binding protein